VRHAAARGKPVPEGLEGWVAKVRERAYAATDADVAALRAAGYSEDQIFEATVAAAVGAGLERFDAGVRALR
jgi:alkylhydroperoxidase family enzyme